MSGEGAQWWEARRAQSMKPATYRCPLCGRQLPALSEHMLLFPEGDHNRRRHAHSECVMRARQTGQLMTRAEWLASQPPRLGRTRRDETALAGWWARLLGRRRQDQAGA